MLEGVFKFMQHDHFFLALSETSTEMRDRFTFAAPLPVLGPIAERLFLKGYMERFLRHRKPNPEAGRRVREVVRLPAKARQRLSTGKKLSPLLRARIRAVQIGGTIGFLKT